jgi:hypothetical protein
MQPDHAHYFITRVFFVKWVGVFGSSGPAITAHGSLNLQLDLQLEIQIQIQMDGGGVA